MLSSLIVPIDADLGGLRKSLRDAQQLIRRSTSDLNAMATTLTRSVSLPLLGIGVGAIKAAADMQQLTQAISTTMKGAGYSVQQTADEITGLRDAAKAPGLDFEQAIKGSIRLQNVGYSAAKARDILVQLANAVSISGGTAQEFDGVTRQMSQMAAKGKVMQQDLTIMVENMPILSKIMKETFGTTTAEGLRDMGISADKFIEGITKGMTLLPRVTGGLANDIVNAFTAIKLAAAEIGTVLNERLKIGEKLSGFADFISGMADAFKSMSPTAQTAVLGVVAFAAALGPAIRLSSALIGGLGGLANGITQARIFIKELAFGTEAMTAAQVRLNMAMRANVIGAVIGVALALAAAYAMLKKDTSAAAQAQEQVGIVEKMASNSIAEQMVKVNMLSSTLKSNVASLDAKKLALAELNKIAPEYFGKVKIGTDVVAQATSAQNAYRESLMKTARAQAAMEQLVAIEKQLNDIRLKRGTFSDDEKRALGVLGVASKTTDALQRQKEVLDAQEAPLAAMRDKLTSIAEENRTVAATTQKVTDSTKDNTTSVKENTKAKKERAAAEKEENDKWEKEIKMLGEIESAWTAEAKAVDDAMAARAAAGPVIDTSGFQGQVMQLGQNLVTALTPAQQLFANLKDEFSGGLSGFGEMLPTIDPKNVEGYAATVEMFKEMETALTGLSSGVIGFGDAFKAVSDYIAENGNIMQQSFLAMGEAVGQAAQSGASSFRELASAALKSAREIVGAWIRQGVAAAISKALSGLPFPFNIAAGAAAGGLAQAAFNGVLKGLKIPAFASGTDFAPGGMSLVGELGPELVNLPRGSQVIPNHKLGAGAVQQIQVRGVLVGRGRELVAVIEEETTVQKRKK